MAVSDSLNLSWKNDIGEYTIASDVAAETKYPLTNMQNNIANEPTAIDMTGETSVMFTFSSATERSAGAVAIHGHNCVDGTTVHWKLYPNESLGGTPLDLGAQSITHNIPLGVVIAGYDAIEGDYEAAGRLKTHWSKCFPNERYKSASCEIANPAGFPDDVLLIDKMWIGFSIAFDIGPDWGFETVQEDGSEHIRKPGGGVETVQREVRRVLRFKVSGTANSERQVSRHTFDRATKSGDLLIIMDPNNVMSLNYEISSIYKRTSDTSYIATHYNWHDWGFAGEEN